MRRLLSAVVMLLALTLTSCGGHANSASVPNIEASLIAPATILSSPTTVSSSQASCAPNHKCAAGGVLAQAITSQSSSRGTLSITPVNCPSGAWCVIQGQSLTVSGFYWWLLNPGPTPATIVTTQITATPNVTYSISPNPIAENANPLPANPVTYGLTINASNSAAVGVEYVTISGTSNDGSTLIPLSWSYYICDAKTGSCLGPTASPTPCGDTSNNPPGTTYGSKLRRSLSACVAVTPIPPPVPNPKSSSICAFAVPAPIPVKPLEIAARTAHVVIPFTDAAYPCVSTLTWKVAGAPAFFKNIHFGQLSTNVPHTNTLIFDVDKDTTPGDYPLNVTLTRGLYITSEVGVVTVRVPHVILYDALENPSGIFELDQNDQVYVPDATQFTESGPITVADFPLDPTANVAFNSAITLASTMRKTQSEGEVGVAECYASGLLDNSTHDKTSGSSPAQINYKVYCVGATPVSVTQGTTYFSVGHARLPSVPDQTFPCSVANVPSNFYTQPNSDVSECATGFIPLKSYPGQASKILQRIVHISVLNDVMIDFGGPVMKTILNTKNVAYPAIQFDGGNGKYVPFPNIKKPLANCPESKFSTPTCPISRTTKLRRLTIAYYATQSWTVPAGITKNSGAGYDTHHILPTGCGGDNITGNGVFLQPRTQHDPFTQWWINVPPCAPNKVGT